MPLLPDEIQAVRRLAEAGDFTASAPDPAPPIERDPAPDYLEMLRGRFRLQRPLKIAVDPGNGVATLTGPPALRGLGAEVVGLHTELLEGFPHHLPDPQEPGSMRELAARVVAEGADLGIAWDGDGDRVGLVDETGRRYDPDWIAALLARDVLSRHPGRAHPHGPQELALPHRRRAGPRRRARPGPHRLLDLPPPHARRGHRLRRRGQRAHDLRRGLPLARRRRLRRLRHRAHRLGRARSRSRRTSRACPAT